MQVWGGSSHAPGTGSSSGLVIPGVSSEEDSLPEAPAPSRNTSYSSLCSLDLYGGASSSGPNGPSESGAGGQAALSLLRGVLGKLPINNGKISLQVHMIIKGDEFCDKSTSNGQIL